MDIKKFLKPDKNIIVELSDEVEYLINESAAEAIQRGDEKITLIRLYDKKAQVVDAQKIEEVLLREGVIDYI